MLADENPFTPSFGEIPVHVAGRARIIEDAVRAFSSTRRRPELTTLFSGACGTGKTTLLSILAHKAEECGWIAAGTTALPGMLDDIESELRRRSCHLIAPEGGSVMSGLGIPQVVEMRFETRPKTDTWRSRMNDILNQLEAQGTGLLITVDEIDPRLDEMVELAAVYQHFVREGRKVSLLMAGLPHNVSALLADKTVSFLRRAQTVRLGRIPDYEVSGALLKTIREYGRTPDAEGLGRAVSSIEGFPFLMQLVGYRAWDVSPERSEISLEDFEQGIAVAHEEMRERILEATYRELSPEDIRFACAMVQDEGESSIADIVERLDRSASQVSQYRRRLIDAGVIGERKRGFVGFDLPYFREFLIEKEDIQLPRG